ncbi:MAG: hypothetical protein MJK10_01100 [Pseudomonadales bacterium]|nr:hypothetical protein [Pseudomonadales bacterium]NRA14471.1 hypothetical protein [Oceanospirillaceae bacterium]
MKFEEHGVFKIETEANLLFVDATGPFSDGVTKHYIESVEFCIQQLEVSQWNQIITLHQLSLFTPEVEKLLTAALINRKKRGLKAVFLILEDVYFKSLIKEQWSRCYTKAEIEHHFFDSTSEAKKSLIHFPYL